MASYSNGPTTFIPSCRAAQAGLHRPADLFFKLVIWLKAEVDTRAGVAGVSGVQTCRLQLQLEHHLTWPVVARGRDHHGCYIPFPLPHLRS